MTRVIRKSWLNGGASVLVLALAASGAAHAAALPSGGHYVSGKGEIGKAGQSLTVKQSSTTGIIDWNRFSIGSKNAVTFDNGSGATLNRVTGGNLSTIAGSLHATGSLYLMSSSGVIVAGSGRVVTGGSFAASTGNISNSAFNDGDRRFGIGRGTVVNRGSITAGGTAMLAGRNVSDSGSIHAAQVNLDARRDLAIAGSITAVETNGAGGSLTAHAHTIVIGADGAIDASASSAGQKGGRIRLVARDTTMVAGTLKADGGKDSAGGFIEISGGHVHVANSAKVSTLAANGKTGTWLIDPKNFTIASSGGDITGAELSSELASNDVTIKNSQGSKSGKGDIVVDDVVDWTSSSVLTLDAFHSITIDQTIDGELGGLTLEVNDGGTGGEVTQPGARVNVSTLDLLGDDGTFDLFDKDNRIATLEGDTGSIDLGDGGALTIGDVTTSGTLKLVGDKNSSAITITGQITANELDFSFKSSHAISENSGASITAQTLTANSNGAVTLDQNNQVANLSEVGAVDFSLQDFETNLTVLGDTTQNVGRQMNLTTVGNINGGATAAAIMIDGYLSAQNMNLNSAGRIIEGATGHVYASVLSGESHGLVRLSTRGNEVTELSSFQTNGNHSFSLIDYNNLTVGTLTAGNVDLQTTGKTHDLVVGSISGNTVDLTSEDNLQIDTSIDADTVNLDAVKRVSESNGSAPASITANLLNVTAGTGILLNSSDNDIRKLGTDKTTSGPNLVNLGG